MKIIAEVQNEIKDISIRLGELNRYLDELKPTDTINAQTDFVKINRLAQQHPIEVHILEQADNYKKKLYLSLLSAIAQTNNDHREGKLVFLQRIGLGMGYEGSLESIIKDGMDINDKLLDEFIKCMTDNDSKQSFIFESLIISNLGGEIDDIAKKYISELSGYLGIGKDETIFLIKLSVCVLEQSMDKYKQLVYTVPKTVNIFIFFNAYLKDFVNGIVCDTKWLYYVYGIDADAELVNSTNEKNLDGTKVIFKNVQFDLVKIKENTRGITLKNCSSVTFEKCYFKGSTTNPICFATIDYINFINCKFVGFQYRVCGFNSECKDVVIERCIFERCGYISSYSESEEGGCFRIDTINSFILIDSEFFDCGLRCKRWSNGAIARFRQVNNFKVENTNFTNCQCRDQGSECSNIHLFSNLPNKFKSDEYFINCKTINSSKLYW